jgi:hypothetical protein
MYLCEYPTHLNSIQIEIECMYSTSLNVTTEYDECAHQRVSKRSKGKVIVVLASLVLGCSWLL